jgi:hypothetical protein
VSFPSAQSWLVENAAEVKFARVDGYNLILVTIGTPWAHVHSMTFQGYDLLDVVTHAIDAVKRRKRWMAHDHALDE